MAPGIHCASVFIGHFALGFAAKRVVPRVPLAMLFVAAQLADLLWPVLVALGIEVVRIDPGNTAFTPLDFVSYPYSHSLLLLAVWAVLLGVIYGRIANNERAFVVLVLLVLSHWVLDFVTHRPDMPLYPGGPKVGLGLWNSVPATIAVEVTMYVVGCWIYFQSTRARDGVGRWAWLLLVALLLVAYFAAGSTPPPSVTALWITALLGIVLTLLLSVWADRHREAVRL
jgi:membrane-bound metal-dependent hydrolase YbcI (DUF457 family)